MIGVHEHVIRTPPLTSFNLFFHPVRNRTWTNSSLILNVKLLLIINFLPYIFSMCVIAYEIHVSNMLLQSLGGVRALVYEVGVLQPW